MSADIVTTEIRSRMMRSVRQKDTNPELRVRSIVHSLGARFRVHNRDWPGSPDIANRSKGWAIFVHGCFWHGHKRCRRLKGRQGPQIPVANKEYWEKKLSDNRARDARKTKALNDLGFRVLTVWECEIQSPDKLTGRLKRWLRAFTP